MRGRIRELDLRLAIIAKYLIKRLQGMLENEYNKCSNNMACRSALRCCNKGSGARRPARYSPVRNGRGYPFLLRKQEGTYWEYV